MAISLRELNYYPALWQQDEWMASQSLPKGVILGYLKPFVQTRNNDVEKAHKGTFSRCY